MGREIIKKTAIEKRSNVGSLCEVRKVRAYMGSNRGKLNTTKALSDCTAKIHAKYL